MELIIVLCLTIAIVWIVLKVHVHDRHMDKIAKNGILDEAWQTVLADPHYEQRRQFEEHRYNAEAKLREEKAALLKASLRKSSGQSNRQAGV